MPRKYLASYKKLASKRGFMDPLEYVFRRYEHERKQNNHDKALELAEMLIPYGHGKRAAVNENGETADLGLVIEHRAG